MTTYGLKLMSELRDARDLVRQAEMAHDAGLGFVSISDHIHPWLSDHDHSPFAWSVLGAIASRVPDLELATGVTCPSAATTRSSWRTPRRPSRRCRTAA